MLVKEEEAKDKLEHQKPPIASVRSAIRDVFDEDYATLDNVVVLENGDDYEKHLIRAGYSEPMISAICEHEEDASFFELYIQRMQGQKRKGGLIRNYDHANGRTEALTDLCHGGKTEYALPVAKKLIGLANSAQRIPPKIEQLFTALAAKIGRERNIAEGGRA